MDKNNDVLSFVIENYGDKIYQYLRTKDLTVTFFSSCDSLVDEIKSEGENILKYEDYRNRVFNVKFLQDYSFNDIQDKRITDFNYCKVENFNFIKVVTPFTMERSYDFLIAKSSEINDIINILKERELKQNFKFKDFPIVGINFKEIEESSIKFLMNEDFRKYCEEHHIKLKRGIILQGKPGTGKTLTLQWLRRQSELNHISYKQFKSIDEFVEEASEYFSEGKKIFVFEDFDAALVERKKTGEAPNQILGKILNILEGVEEINDVVSIFTTNNIDVFDEAFIRPGRIDKVFNYNLPERKQYFEFFESYIPEEKEFHEEMADILEAASSNISYAMLKGICDDINIFKFSGNKLTKDKINSIIREKMNSANKTKSVEDKNSYVL